MIHFIANALKTAGELLEPERIPQTAPASVRHSPDEGRMSIRREAAMSIMDDDVLAFFMVRVVDNDGIGVVNMQGDVPDRWWPYVAHTLREIAKEASSAGGE